MDAPLRVLFVTPEVAPFARTSGLGDVTCALPKALAAQGYDVQVVIPLYQIVRDGAFPLTELLTDLQAPFAADNRTARVWQDHLPERDHPGPCRCTASSRTTILPAQVCMAARTAIIPTTPRGLPSSVGPWPENRELYPWEDSLMRDKRKTARGPPHRLLGQTNIR